MKPTRAGRAVPTRLDSLRRRLASSEPPPESSDDRVGRVAARFSSLSKILTSLALALLVVAIGFVVIREFRDDSIYIDPISVPPSLVEQGISSAVASARIAQRISAIQSETERRPLGDPVFAVDAQRHDIALTAVGISMSRLVGAVKRAIGAPDLRVSGEVTRINGRTAIGATFLKNGVHADAAIEPDPLSPDVIADRGARVVLQVADPELLTRYTFQQDMKNPSGPAKFRDTRELLAFRERTGLEFAAPEILYWRMLIDDAEGNLAAGLKRADSLIASNWRPANTRLWASTIATEIGDEARALRYLQEARSLPSITSAELAWLGDQYRFLGRPKERLDALRRAFSRDPGDYTVRSLLADCLAEVHRAPEARLLLEAVPLPRARDDLIFYVPDLAYVAMRQGDSGRVSELLSQFGSVFPDNHASLFWLKAEDAVARGDLDAAENFWREAAARNRDWDEPSIRLADIALMRNDFSRSLSLYEACLSRFPHEARCRVGKARSLLKLERWTDADRAFAHLYEEDPDDVQALREWSVALAALGRSADSTAKLTLASDAEQRLSIPLGIVQVAKR